MVDANGAFRPAAALAQAEGYAELGVGWFEEPVSSDDPVGMARVRDRAPAGMSIAAGEYSWSVFDADRLLEAQAVDVLQADVTRCGGVTGMLAMDPLCKVRCLPFSAHCAPALSAHVGCAMETFVHLEFFHDHARLERMLFDGTPELEDGHLVPDPSRPGLGLELRHADAAPHEVWRSER